MILYIYIHTKNETMGNFTKDVNLRSVQIQLSKEKVIFK